MKNALKIRDKKTGQIYSALYDTNRLGNKQMWVEGKFYPDKVFYRRFEVINQNEAE